MFGVDTGCVHGLRLTGLVVPEFNLCSVPARKNWWAEVKASYGYSLEGLSPSSGGG